MEAADSICYLVMDIEDGFNKKYYNVDFVIQYLESNGNEYVKQLIKSYLKMCSLNLIQILEILKIQKWCN